jgi:hypothetical protein
VNKETVTGNLKRCLKINDETERERKRRTVATATLQKLKKGDRNCTENRKRERAEQEETH